MTLETWLKIHNVYNFVTVSQNRINSLKFFSFSNCKIRRASTTCKELIRKSRCLPFVWAYFTHVASIYANLLDKRKRVHKKRVHLPEDWFGTPTWPPWRHVKTIYMVLGDAVTKLQRFVWIFNHVSRVITWSLFNFRALNLLQKPISTWPVIWWCQFIDWFEFETRPSSLRNSEMANKARIFFPNSVSFIGYFKVTWHPTMVMIPAKSL